MLIQSTCDVWSYVEGEEKTIFRHNIILSILSHEFFGKRLIANLQASQTIFERFTNL